MNRRVIFIRECGGSDSTDKIFLATYANALRRAWLNPSSRNAALRVHAIEHAHEARIERLGCWSDEAHERVDAWTDGTAEVGHDDREGT